MKKQLFVATVLLSVISIMGCTLADSGGCDLGYHSLNGKCEADSSKACGDGMVNCTAKPGVKSAECDKGKCVYKSCKDGYSLISGICKSDTSEACGIDQVKCPEEQTCQSGQCKSCPVGKHFSNGKCIIDDECGNCSTTEICKEGYCEPCPTGYHAKNGVCISDNTQCDCSTDESCPCSDEAICLSGICIQCPEGMHKEDNQCKADSAACQCASDEVCVNEICQKCPEGSHFANGICAEDVIECETCPENQLCVHGECQSCSEDHHVENDICVLDSYKNCGRADKECVDQICVNGECQSCPTGKHAIYGECEEDSWTNCGAHDRVCDNQICQDGTCVDCEIGTHPDKGDCVVDTITHCGGKDCNQGGWLDGTCEQGVCVATQCKENFCLSEGNCIDGTQNESCGNGSSCTTCTGMTQCISGSCEIPTCDSGVCMNNGVCKNDNTHCGSSCLDCTTHHNASEGICTLEGECHASACIPDYHLESDKSGNKYCVEDSSKSCGNEKIDCGNKFCFMSQCLSLITETTPPTNIECATTAKTYTYNLKLSDIPKEAVKVSLSLTDSSGNPLPSRENGIKLSTTSLQFTPSNSNIFQKVTITGASSSIKPGDDDLNYYKNAQLRYVIESLSNPNKYHKITGSIKFNYYAFCYHYYGFTRATQTLKLPKGSYDITLKGAGGGSGNVPGGKGGLATGILNLKSATTVYITVGGTGSKCEESSTDCGGYNGGGKGSTKNGLFQLQCGFGGGGATDIRLKYNNPYYRVMVAGGGGGGFGQLAQDSTNVGGKGGGETGESGRSDGKLASNTPGGGTSGCANGTTSLCPFGYAKSPSTSLYKVGGGGGGWYGGAPGQSDSTSGGGGSSFIFQGKISGYHGSLTDDMASVSNRKLTLGGGSSANNNGSAIIAVHAN